ncbi:hypothetical protein ABZ319_39325 [Nocardia sp. NPDC005978]|uniref:hypothetical protein n=1 Tax=Nocardia sp. NPDC005978 TaxID=3156725 RepID=UPI0033A96B95
MIRDLSGIPLHSAVEAALRSASVKRMREPVDTFTLLTELMRADNSGEWSRIWLHTGGIDTIEKKLIADPVTSGGWYWENIALTDRCALALDISWRLAHRYDMLPIPLAMVVLGLVADSSTAAARALHAGLTRTELLSLVQSDVLGTTLSYLERTLGEVLREAQSTTQPPRPRNPAGEEQRGGHTGFWLKSPLDQAPPLSSRRLKVIGAGLIVLLIALIAVDRSERGRPPPAPSPTRVTVAPPTFTLEPAPTFRYTIQMSTRPR